MFRIQVAAFAVLSLFLTHLTQNNYAQADLTNRWEVWSGSLASFGISLMSGPTVTNVNVFGTGLSSGMIVGVPGPAVGYQLGAGFEGVMSFGYNYIHRTTAVPTSSSVLRYTVGLVYNFSKEIENSYFIRGDLGFSRLAANDLSQTRFFWGAYLGKRFKLFEHVSWTPMIAYEGVQTIPKVSMALSAVPVQISLHF